MFNLLKLRKNRVFISVFVLASVLGGCSGFTQRSFIDEMEDSDAFLTPGKHFRTVAGDNGKTHRSSEEIRSRTPASRSQQKMSRYEKSVQSELNKRVNQLNDQEYSQYQIHKQYLNGASEKVYYLELSPYERMEYIRLRGFNPSVTRQELREAQTDYMKKRAVASSQVRQTNERSPQSETQDEDGSAPFMGMSFYETRSPDNAPISMGMSKDEVVRKWGEPHQVDYAGNPRNENERWSFHVAGKVRKVFFESGQVEGWILE